MGVFVGFVVPTLTCRIRIANRHAYSLAFLASVATYAVFFSVFAVALFRISPLEMIGPTIRAPTFIALSMTFLYRIHTSENTTKET